MSGQAGKLRVAVVFGGRSAEHAISCVSAGSVLAALDPDRYDVVPVGITREGGWVLPDPGLRLAIVDGVLPEVTGGTAVTAGRRSGRPRAGARSSGAAGSTVDVVFPVLHGAYGEDGTIQGLLEMSGLPYVGSGVFASAASMDKEFTKKLLAAAGLPQGDHVVLRDASGALAADPGLLDDAARERLGLPVFVKPSRAGSSIGISRVTDWAQFARRGGDRGRGRPEGRRRGRRCPGREIECGVLAGPAAGARGEPAGRDPAAAGHRLVRLRGQVPRGRGRVRRPRRPDPRADRGRAGDRLPGLPGPGLPGPGAGRLLPRHRPGRPPTGWSSTRSTPCRGSRPISMFPRMWAATGVDYPELVDRLVAVRAGRRLPSLGDPRGGSRGRPGEPSCWPLVSCLLVPAPAAPRAVDGAAGAGARGRQPRPAAEELAELVLPEVPSGLPRLPDEDLDAAGGRQDRRDVAGVRRRPRRASGRSSRTTATGYGWERFWGDGPGALTGVFVDQFEHPAGAARLRRGPRPQRRRALRRGAATRNRPTCPAAAGCSRRRPAPDGRADRPRRVRLVRPGVFSVAVTAVARTPWTDARGRGARGPGRAAGPAPRRADRGRSAPRFGLPVRAAPPRSAGSARSPARCRRSAGSVICT